MSITNLPLELVQEILLYLNLRSIRDFRLVNRSCKEACNGPPWVRFFTSLRTGLSHATLGFCDGLITRYNLERTVRRLEILAQCMVPPDMREYLELQRRRRVGSSAVPITSLEEPHFTELHAAVQRDSLEWLRSHRWSNHPNVDRATISRLTSILCRLEKLDTVILSPSLTRGYGTDPYYVETHLPPGHYMTLMAMARSNIQVSTLSVFGDTTFFCFLHGDLCSALSSNPAELRVIGERLETLKLGMSATGNGYNPNTHDTTGLARFLQHTPHLRKLDLALRNTHGRTAVSDAIFVAVANDVYLPRLEECGLSGFCCRDDGSLRMFLTRHAGTLQRLFLTSMGIGSGSWHIALCQLYLISAFPAFKCARLYQLSVGWVMTYLQPTIVTRTETGVIEKRTGWV
ncbi:hypothetical protein BDW42DRAFT_68325 [Aspergillus taichungensis]|uniref:F-box domain-containing protein n=1 Tax=Aspergillus taichungensis TaxID=482145 RepID=A0A2J5HZZ8_9EURO|nr:hypothetical protein BDW42DRAFT_68325 [Aspergillus taichungensis]